MTPSWSNTTSSWSLDLPQPPEGEGWQNMGESFFRSARSSVPLTSSTQTLFSRRWVKPLPPDAPPEQKPEEILIVLSATFSRT